MSPDVEEHANGKSITGAYGATKAKALNLKRFRTASPEENCQLKAGIQGLMPAAWFGEGRHAA